MAVDSSKYRYKPGGLLLPIVVGLLAVVAALHAVSVPLSAWTWTVYDRVERAVDADGGVDDALFAESESNDLANIGMAVLYTPTYLLTAVCFLCLVYRVGANAHRLAPGVETAAGWAVGWYFVPFANLFKPYQAMAEYFRASRPRAEGGTPADWKEADVPGLLGVWWGLWLVGGVLSQASVRVSLAGADRDDYAMEKLSCLLDVAASAVGIGASLTAIWMFRTAFRWQAARRTERRAERDENPEAVGATADGRFLLAESCRECGEPVSGDPTECGMCGARRPARRKRG